jgi:hypothetical protein
MVRKGVLAFLVLGLGACTQDVDDPANFTAGNSNGNSAGSSSGGNQTDGNTSADDNGNGQTSTTGSADNTGDPPPETTGPATTGPTGNCGNGVIDAGEQCDGNDLQGFDCASLGLNGGTLACDGMMCTFDTSMCSSSTGTSG